MRDKTEIFAELRETLLPYSPPFKKREGKNVSGKDSFELWAEGEFEAFGRKRKEIFFAGLIMQKAYVGFYFMPIYSDPEAMRKIFSPRLLKCLKGKSCFYIKDLDDDLKTDIKRALAEGFALYNQREWV